MDVEVLFSRWLNNVRKWKENILSGALLMSSRKLSLHLLFILNSFYQLNKLQRLSLLFTNSVKCSVTTLLVDIMSFVQYENKIPYLPTKPANQKHDNLPKLIRMHSERFNNARHFQSTRLSSVVCTVGDKTTTTDLYHP